MPYIGLKTNILLNEEKKTALKSAFGKAIEKLPGKTETWLMVSVEGDISLYFKGKGDAPFAFVQVALLGTAGRGDYESMTEELCRVIGDIAGITADHIYVKYEECEHWGWNGSNF